MTVKGKPAESQQENEQERNAGQPEKRPGSGERDAKGRFVDGAGNLRGRPRDVHGLAAIARSHGPELIKLLLDVARKGRGPARVAAIRELLDRGYGRPLQSLDVVARPGAPDGEALAHLGAGVARLLADDDEVPALTAAPAIVDGQAISVEVVPATEGEES